MVKKKFIQRNPFLGIEFGGSNGFFLFAAFLFPITSQFVAYFFTAITPLYP